MSQPRKWKDEIADSLRQNGGHCHLKQLYDTIERRGIMDFNANKNWHMAVNNVLETHSSDSSSYLHNEDLFYSVDGIRKGVWGLR